MINEHEVNSILSQIKSLIINAGPHGSIKASDLAEAIGEDPVALAKESDERQFRALNDISDAEKIAAFDGLYQQCAENLAFLREKGNEPKDCAHYAWEAVMYATLGPQIFDVWNSYM